MEANSQRITVIKEGKIYKAYRGNCEGQGSTSVKAIEDLKETEMFIRISTQTK